MRLGSSVLQLWEVGSPRETGISTEELSALVHSLLPLTGQVTKAPQTQANTTQINTT